MSRHALWASVALLFAGVAVMQGCGSLARFLGLRAPSFEVVTERESVLSLDPASVLAGQPSATLSLWVRVTNPNDLGLTITSLTGNVFLEGSRMADVELPLGLPLPARRDTVVPLQIRFGLPALAGLGAVGEALLLRQSVAYRLDGVVRVDAGTMGEPAFGPRTWVQGRVDVR